MSGKIRWLGAAFIDYISENNRRIIFDPWTKTEGNTNCPLETNEIENTDLIIVSHDHFDHVASASSICKKTGGLLCGPDETMKRLISEEGLKPEQIINNGSGYLAGGGANLDWVKIIAVPAFHTSNTSQPLGTIVIIKDGITLYHTGDTALLAEMEIYARLYPVDILILPIFGIATMDAYQAAEAVKMVKPKKVMPVHFDFCKNP